MSTTLPQPAPVPRFAGETHLSETVLVRIGGLPCRLFDDLRSRAVIDVLARAFDKETQFGQLTETLVECLHNEVARYKADATIRPLLLSVKRDVYNRRRLSTDTIKRCRASVSIETTASLRTWIDLQDELSRTLALGGTVLEKEKQAQRAALKQIAQRPEFRSGLLLSSPVFERALDDYLACNATVLDRKLRRTERTLLLYLARTCYKTTPFSTLTPVCVGEFLESSGELGRDRFPHLENRVLAASVRPNLGFLARLVDSLKRDVRRLSESEVSLKQGWTEVDHRVRYLRRAVTPLSRSGPLHSSVTEREFRIPISPSLRTILDLFAEREVVTMADALGALTHRNKLPETDALAYVSLLVELDFITVPALRQSVLSNYWARFVDATAARVLGPDSPEITSLRGIADAAERYPDAGLVEKRRLLQSIETQGRIIISSPTPDEILPQPVLYEDATLTGEPVGLSRSDWEPHIRDLSIIQSVLPLFDLMTVSRMAMSTLFVKMYGQGGICSDILSFAEFFAEVYYRPFQETLREVEATARGIESNTPNPFGLEAVTAIDAATVDLWSAVSLLDERRGGNKEIEIPESLIERLVSRLPDAGPLLSHSFFCQLAHSDDRHVLVLNQMHSGMTSMYSRFCHAFASDAGRSLVHRLRATLHSLEPPDALFAEIQGSHDNNLNLHPLLADAELLCPGETASASRAKQILLTELSVRHDRLSDRLELIWNKVGKRIIPLYLGFLHPMVLPELHRVLLHFSCVSSVRPQWRPTPIEKPQSVVFRPRIRFGSLILERAHWRVPVSLIPRRNPGQGDFLHLLNVTQWLRSQNIPSQFFLRATLRPTTEGRANAADDGIAQKPVFIDLENVFGLFLFEKIVLDATGEAVFWEFLPGRDDVCLQREGDAYVSEYVVELTRKGAACSRHDAS